MAAGPQLKSVWSTPDCNIDVLDGEQFEDCLAELFDTQGLDVCRTRKFGDYGADLVVVRELERIVVQAKRSTKPVGLRAVQEVVAARPHYTCDRAWVVSNHYFTRQAKKLAASNEVELWSRDQMRDALESVGLLDQDRPAVEPQCWRCGIKLIVRSGRNGQFFGCRNYPNCHCILPRSADRPLWFRSPRTATSAASIRVFSGDGRYWWDGSFWVDSEKAAPAWAHRSPDGWYWWDGLQWRPVPQSP